MLSCLREPFYDGRLSSFTVIKLKVDTFKVAGMFRRNRWYRRCPLPSGYYSALAWRLNCTPSTSADRHTEWTVPLPFLVLRRVAVRSVCRFYVCSPLPSSAPSPSPSPSSTILPTPSDTHRHQYHLIILRMSYYHEFEFSG